MNGFLALQRCNVLRPARARVVGDFVKAALTMRHAESGRQGRGFRPHPEEASNDLGDVKNLCHGGDSN